MSSPNERRRNPRHAGDESRTKILVIIREIIASGESLPPLEEFASRVGLSKTTVHHHLAWLERNRVIEISEPRRDIRILIDEMASVPTQPKRGRPRTRPLTLRESITAAIGALHLVDGRRVPVTLVAMTARILESESALIAHEVAAMVIEGALIQIDGGYLLPEINK